MTLHIPLRKCDEPSAICIDRWSESVHKGFIERGTAPPTKGKMKMNLTATQIRLPANVSVRVGQFVRFNALGRFMRVDNRVVDGLGITYVANRDGTFDRFFF